MPRMVLVAAVLVVSALFGCGAAALAEGVPSSLSGAPTGGAGGNPDSASSSGLRAAGQRAEWVFGWVAAITTAFAGVAFVSEKSESA